jgi:hypothetical protein
VSLFVALEAHLCITFSAFMAVQATQDTGKLLSVIWTFFLVVPVLAAVPTFLSDIAFFSEKPSLLRFHPVKLTKVLVLVPVGCFGQKIRVWLVWRTSEVQRARDKVALGQQVWIPCARDARDVFTAEYFGFVEKPGLLLVKTEQILGRADERRRGGRAHVGQLDL